jgi:hypothetical protein
MSSAPGGDDGNGRVTLALLKQSVDAQNTLLKEFIGEQRRCNEKTDDRLSDLERDTARQDEKIKTLQSRDMAGTVTGVFTGVVAGLIALFKP